jgi:phage terminase large subunit-like protein
MRWVSFFPEYCVLIEGESDLVGRPLDLLDWQVGPTRELFGWKCVSDDGILTDVRRYQTMLCLIPKKNSKTTWSAGLSLALCKLDDHIQAQNFYCAATEEQAADAGFRIATAMVERSEKLNAEYEAFERHIYHRQTQGVVRLITTAPTGKAGKNVHSAVVDEWWEHQDKKMVKQLRTGMVAQKNPLLIMITTAGDDNTVPAYKDYEEGKRILTGELKNPRYLPVIYEPPTGADWHDRKIWAMVNPALGVSVNLDTLTQIYKESLGSPVDEAEFQQFHLNMWQSGAQDFIPDAVWEACAEDFTEESLKGQPCYGALDLAQVDDMCAFARCYPQWIKDMQARDFVLDYKFLVNYWCPKEQVTLRQKKGFRYPFWVRNGLIYETDGEVTDYQKIRDDLVDVIKPTMGLVTIKENDKDRKVLLSAFDRYNSTMMVPLLVAEGFEMVQVPNTMAGVGPATREFLLLARQGRIKHNKNEVLKWNVSNAKVIKDDKNNMMITKKRSKDKVDGLAACIMALELAMKSPPPKPPKSSFSERGLFII